MGSDDEFGVFFDGAEREELVVLVVGLSEWFGARGADVYDAEGAVTTEERKVSVTFRYNELAPIGTDLEATIWFFSWVNMRSEM